MNEVDMKKYNKEYLELLKRELLPAFGCTEPISIALAAAKATETLGRLPKRIVMHCSRNIIKNASGVVVPGSGNRRGIEIAACLGAVGGDTSKNLEVLSGINDEDRKKAIELANTPGYCTVCLMETDSKLYVRAEVEADGHAAAAEVQGTHTCVTYVEKDGVPLYQGEVCAQDKQIALDMSVKEILDFASNVPLEEIESIIEAQIACNTAIAEAGLGGGWGAEVGKTLMEVYGDSVENRARAAAAAGSDARMSGCELPVIINSGSGNQGMTVSLPVIEYAKEYNSSKEQLTRALLVSNLVALHQKASIGVLSAYCGVVSAAVGSAAGIAYLQNESLEVIEAAIVNALANVSGIICDGAKPSCAAKIASSVDAALLGLNMAKQNRGFKSGEGIVKEDVENTIQAIGRLASEGMEKTDDVILDIMIDNTRNHCIAKVGCN